MAEPSTITKLDSLERDRQMLETKSGKMKPFFIGLPILVIIGTVILRSPPEGIIVAAIWSMVLSFAIFFGMNKTRFKKIKNQFKEAIIEEYMRQYHPDMVYDYSPGKKEAQSIITKFGLENADRYKEEDVLTGLYGDTEYYISEIDLDKSTGKSYVSIFKGLLFRLKKKDATIKKARIQSKAGILNKLFKTYKKNEAYGFNYYAEDETGFKEQFGNLFPFIRYLNAKSKDLRIHFEGDEIVIMMKSKMKLLDDPALSMNKSLKNPGYNQNFAKQINTLLYIVEAFEKNFDRETIEEKLELKILEAEKKTLSED